jgi:chemotaxis signal transduction protein
MQTKRLLTFRWCGKEYGIAVEDVLGISTCSLDTCQPLSWEAWQKTENRGAEDSWQEDGNKRVLLVNTGGLQIGLIIDEIVAVVDFDTLLLTENRGAALQLWNFTRRERSSP